MLKLFLATAMTFHVISCRETLGVTVPDFATWLALISMKSA